MPTVEVPLFSRTYKNADAVVLSDDAAIQYNGFLDSLQGLNIRPGEVLAYNSAARNDGLYFWPDKDFIVSVDNGAVSLKTVSGQTLVDAYTGHSVTFTPGEHVVFCNDSNYVFMAGGGKINYVDELGVVTEIADADAPTEVTHIGFIDGYILAIMGNKLYWSNIPTTTDWSALNFASAEGNPDLIKAMIIVQRQIYLLGTVSTEIWQNDGESPFSRIPGGLIEIGIAAKYSVIKLGNSLIWLGHDKRFVKFTGTEVKQISDRYDQEIASFSSVSDCVGGVVDIAGQIYCIFNFPTEGRTLAYDPVADDWSEWSVWDDAGMNWLAYDFRSVVKDLNSGKVFVGKERAQVISCLDENSRVDLTSASATKPFKFLRQTGFIDHGSSKKKRNEELRFRVKRGAAAVTNPKLMLRYRNNGENSWSNIKEIGLGNIGETAHHVTLKRLGIYRSRQYEISCTDNVPLVLAKAEEDITVLR